MKAGRGSSDASGEDDGAPAAKRNAPTAERPLRLEAIYEQHFEDVYRLVSLLGGPGLGAEAATVRVFLRLDRRLTKVNEAMDLRTELMRIAVKVVRIARRSLPRRARRHSRACSGDPTRTQAYQILDEMPSHEREALILSDFARLGPDQVARVFRCTTASAVARIERARTHFARSYGRWSARER